MHGTMNIKLRIRLTDQTKLLHWIILPEDDVVFGSYSHENIKQCMCVILVYLDFIA